MKKDSLNQKIGGSVFIHFFREVQEILPHEVTVFVPQSEVHSNRKDVILHTVAMLCFLCWIY